MKTLLPALLLSAGLAASAAADEFAANTMLVASADSASPLSGSVRLLASDGKQLGLIVNMADPVDMTIGPDGLLYVVSAGDDRIRVAKATPTGGQVTAILGAGTGLRALAFGPRGNLFVAARDDGVVYEFQTDGVLVRTIGTGSPMSAPVDVGFGPDGRLYVASDDDARVHVFDSTGAWLHELGAATPMTSASALAFDAEGHLLVASADDDLVYEIDLEGNSLSQIGAGSGLSDPRGLSFGPDGQLHVVSTGDDLVYVFSPAGELLRTVSPGLGGNVAPPIAFVPHRFSLALDTRVFEDDVEMERVKEMATISLQPGSCRIMLSLPPSGTKVGDTFGDEFLVLYGYEAFVDDAKGGKKREFWGRFAPESPLEEGAGTVAFDVSGKVGGDGFFAIKKARGSLLRLDNDASASGKVQTKSLLN